ncbi:MAG: hypothetical protein ACLFPW_14955 [Spirochaetaceae bacterium]
MFETVIVGGGIHGTLLQLAILRQDGSLPVVIDPEPEPLAVWKRVTTACGMRYLRSSSSHNLELDVHALRRFARKRGYGESHFIQPHMRPSLELFNAHADYLVDRHGLGERVRDEVVEIAPESPGFLLRGAAKSYRARRVILAPGMPPPVVPWPEEDVDEPSRALHIFDPRFTLDGIGPADTVGIVGCGVTGGQLAITLRGRGVREVTIFDIAEPTEADYDGNPCYVGPKCGDAFEKLARPEERRREITLQRYPGTLPREIYAELSALRNSGALRFEKGRVTHLRHSGDQIELELIGKGSSSPRLYAFDRVVAATGFAAIPPVADLIAPLADSQGLPRGPEGYPVPDETLQWMPELYVAGALGELRIGPPARNIIGAHLTARRILPSLQGASVA